MADRIGTHVLVLAIAVTGLIAAGVRPSQAQTVDPEFRVEVVKLLEATGTMKVGVQTANAAAEPMINALGAQGGLPAPAVAIVRQTLSDAFEQAFSDKGGLLDDIITIYSKHLTIADVRGLAAFYQTELGKKMISTMPAIAQESSAAGQRWAAAQMPVILNQLQERLKKEGYLK
jgi:hypothetical protein